MNKPEDISDLISAMIELIDDYAEKITLIPVLGILETTKMELLNQARESILRNSHH